VVNRANDSSAAYLVTRFTVPPTDPAGGIPYVGRRFGENKEFGVRINGMYRDGDAAVNDQSKESQTIHQRHIWSLDLPFHPPILLAASHLTKRRDLSTPQLGGHVDVGRRFGENKEFGVRINGMYRDGDAAVNDCGQSCKRFISGIFGH
jgi:hypothetical protein